MQVIDYRHDSDGKVEIKVDRRRALCISEAAIHTIHRRDEGLALVWQKYLRYAHPY